MEMFNLRKLNEREDKDRYCVEVLNRKIWTLKWEIKGA
jgi:hypothetical protein